MSSGFNIKVDPPGHDEGKLHRLLEGPTQAFPGNASIAQYFERSLQDGTIDPESVAVKNGEVEYTFQQLDDISSRFAEAMREHLQNTAYKNGNPDQDTIIGVCIAPSERLVFCLFAIAKLGAAYLPFDVTFPEERVTKIVKDSKPIMVISDHHSNVLAKFDGVKDLTRVISTADLQVEKESTEEEEGKESEEVSQEEEEEEEEETLNKNKNELVYITGTVRDSAENTAIVLYTSGSSGEPKGVRLSNRNIMNRLQWQWQEFPFEDSEKCVFKTSLTFVDSVAEIFGPLLQGKSIVVFSKVITSQPNLFIQKLSTHGITRLVLVPSLLKAMFQTMQIVGLEEGRAMLRSIKLWVCSGEALTKDLLEEFFEHFPRDTRICNLYGSTEVMADVTFVSFSSKHDVYRKTVENNVPIGLPVNNTVVYILDPSMELCEPNVQGEIYISGYNLCKGYVGIQEHPSFVPNPYSHTLAFQRLYRTGDFGRIMETPGGFRYLSYEGRVDSQIKVRGQRVDLAEIELTMQGIDLISRVKVLVYHAGQDDQAIVAFVVPTGENSFDRISALAESRLRDYERPLIKIIDDIPLLVNGKVDRQRLLQMYEQDLYERSDSVDWVRLEIPAEKVEVAQAVVQTIARVTGTSMEVVADNMDNSFYNIGGSSLNSIMAIVKLREMNFRISIQDFTSAKTIKHIIWYTQPVTGPEEAGDYLIEKAVAAKYTATMLEDTDLEDVAHIIAHSFASHGDLEMYTKATYEEFRTLIKSIWKPLVEKGFSFLIKRASDEKAIAAALNFDVYDEPEEIEASQGIQYVLELLEFVESRQREKLPKGKGKLIHSFMMGTSEEVDESENVVVIEYMEEYVLRLAKEKNFLGIMTTNTSALTQQLGIQIHGYEVLSEYQVNKYVAPDGTKPFMLAPESFKIIVCWKKVKPKHTLEF